MRLKFRFCLSLLWVCSFKQLVHETWCITQQKRHVQRSWLSLWADTLTEESKLSVGGCEFPAKIVPKTYSLSIFSYLFILCVWQNSILMLMLIDCGHTIQMIDVIPFFRSWLVPFFHADGWSRYEFHFLCCLAWLGTDTQAFMATKPRALSFVPIRVV